MGSINKKLHTWLEQGLINSQQLDSILHYEQLNSTQDRSNWWLYSLLILGASIIGLGIISLIAANWASIPDAIKLVSAFSLLGLLSVAIFWQYGKTDSPWFDALICGFIIMCLAIIGLIAQIFHLSGQWYHTLLLWSAITLPLVFFGRQLFVHFFWASLFLHAAIWSGVAWSAGDTTPVYERFPALFMFAPLLSAALYSASHLTKYLEDFRSSFYFWFQISALIALVVVDLLRSGGEMREYELAWYLPGYIAAAILAVIVLTRDYRPLNKALLIAIIILFLLYYHPFILFDGNTRYAYSSQQATFWTADDIRAPILTILILFLYATHAGNSGHHRTFNLITFLIGLRFVILYFQAMGGLAATGVGLIMSGLMIIGIAWFWYKSRSRLKRWSEELHE